MRAILIWDGDGPAPVGPWTTVLWRAFAASHTPDVISMPTLVEGDAEALRARYLAWVYELGETRIRGKRVVDHLELMPGFSYWWMTLLAHKPNYYESPQITDAIKCLAFELRCQPLQPTLIRLCTRNAPLRRVFGDYCQRMRIEFRTEIPASERGASPAVVPQRSPRGRTVRAGLSLVARIFRLFVSAEITPASAPSKVCAFDMLLYLRPEAFEQGRFASNYWGPLVSFFEVSKHPTTWLHTFYPHAQIPSVTGARALLRRFTQSSESGARHLLVDSTMNAGTLRRSFGFYVRLVARALALSRGLRASRPSGSAFDLWPLFARNWYESLVGAPAIRNCVRLGLFERALRLLPRQPLGIYIQENQPWEMALLHFWRSSGHGRIVGVPHTTVRFWDLRYYYDRRTYEQTRRNDLPRPDVVAVNGPMARQAYVQHGYPEPDLVEVEALRFAHLLDDVDADVDDGRARPATPRRVLICGDNFPGSNGKLMDIVQGADAQLPRGIEYVFKPHKSVAFDPSKYRSLNLVVQDGDLPEMLRDCDLVLTGNLTSASIDAYCRNKRVASLVDGNALNGSPLRGLPDAMQFSDAHELARILSAAEPLRRMASQRRDNSSRYFCLDAGLPKWRALLGFR